MNRSLSYFYAVFTILILCNNNSFAQQTYLSIEEAIEILFQNNYNIQLAKNNKLIAANNTSKYNTGKLPTVSANAGTNYQFTQQAIKVGDNKIRNLIHRFPLSAGIGVNYVLFDKSRNVTIQQLNESYALSDLQLRQSIESSLSNLFVAYYQVTTLERNIEVQKANLAISKRNLKRTEYAFEYAVATKLGILNSEVNLNNDSISVQNATVNYENAKRNLNVILGRDPAIDFKTDTTITYRSDLTITQLLSDMQDNNLQLLQTDKNMALDQLSLSLAKTGKYPTINANGAYNYNQNFNILSQEDPQNANVLNFQPDYVLTNGVTAGLNLTWNIFDGGRTKHQIENASLSINNTKLYKEELLRQLQRDIYNTWMSYENALFVIKTQQKNIETSERNFERSAEQFKLGNISTTSYREAQTNLLNTQLSYLNALYNAKVLETQLLQLSGNLVSE